MNEIDVTDSLVRTTKKSFYFKLDINNEVKTIRFVRKSFDPKILESHFAVYVSIFESIPIERMHPSYTNKVRQAFLRIQEINRRYFLLTRYSVLNKPHGYIVSWIDSIIGKELQTIEAMDSNIPRPFAVPHKKRSK